MTGPRKIPPSRNSHATARSLVWSAIRRSLGSWRGSSSRTTTKSFCPTTTGPETGRPGIFSSLAYLIGIEGVPDDEASAILGELYQWQTQEAFRYTHQWEERMLVMWDNRSVLHSATGGYDGHARLLHRTTIGAAA